MDDLTLFESRFAERLGAFARTSLQSVDSAAVARAVSVSHPRSAAGRLDLRLHGSATRRRQLGAVNGLWGNRSFVRVALAAAAVAVVVTGALLIARPDLSSIGGPSLTPTVGPSQSVAAAGPSASPSPTPTPTPILWTEASLAEDWPAPVRTEPAGGAILVPILVIRIPASSDGSCCLANEPGRYLDPTGDTGSDVAPWLDISDVTVETYDVRINLASTQVPDVDPTEQWIAYGVVFDDDRDGVPDRRFGTENVPVDPEHRHRTWMTDLHTGQTLVSDGAHIGGAYIDTFFAGGVYGGARFSFGSATPRGPQGMELANRPFYVWASMIQDGRVVATDYAPDVGWLDTSVQTTEIP